MPKFMLYTRAFQTLASRLGKLMPKVSTAPLILDLAVIPACSLRICLPNAVELARCIKSAPIPIFPNRSWRQCQESIATTQATVFL